MPVIGSDMLVGLVDSHAVAFDRHLRVGRHCRGIRLRHDFPRLLVVAAGQATSLTWVAPQARPARKVDVRELSRTLARAFYDDPVMVWLLPDEKPRTAQLYRLFATMTRHHHLARRGVEVACDGPDIGAAALWDPPNEWQETRWAQLAMTPTFVRVFGARSMRGRAVQELMKRVHPEELHWYLAVIGSDPTVRGKGFGQVLMQSRLDRVDAEHAPAYLESTKHQNIGYYQRFGFEVTDEIVLPDGGPTMWPMWRAPR
jgi:GNAT superfamily N-acetyltransferase